MEELRCIHAAEFQEHQFTIYNLQFSIGSNLLSLLGHDENHIGYCQKSFHPGIGPPTIAPVFDMSVIFILIGFSLLLAIGFLIGFIISVKSGQFDDDYTPSVRILFEDTKSEDQNK